MKYLKEETVCLICLIELLYRYNYILLGKCLRKGFPWISGFPIIARTCLKVVLYLKMILHHDVLYIILHHDVLYTISGFLLT